MIFLDTSAIYALADAADDNHEAALRLWQQAQDSGRAIVTHNYVLVESAALLHNRLGKDAAEKLLKDASHLQVHWVAEDLHQQAVSFLDTNATSGISFVDAVSFLVMGHHGIAEVPGIRPALRCSRPSVPTGSRLMTNRVRLLAVLRGDQLADDGIPHVNLPRTPFQQMWIEWANLDDFCAHLADSPEIVAAISEFGRP